MTKYVFVGDIHGKVEQVRAALEKEGTIVFVGDFIDSYDKTVTEHEECLRLVCDAIEVGKAKALFGNHELSYMMPMIHRCSGFDVHRANLMEKYADRIMKLFEPFLFLRGNILVSHAGLTKPIWDTCGLTMEKLLPTLDEWWKDYRSPMHGIGRARGGSAGYGGLFWCDFNQEFQPIPELIQIFGHTRGKGIRQGEGYYCIDCLDFTNEFLELDIEDGNGC